MSEVDDNYSGIFEMEDNQLPPYLPDHFKCPLCHVELDRCEERGCNNISEYEGWITNGSLIQRKRYCSKHAPQFIGWKKHMEKKHG